MVQVAACICLFALDKHEAIPVDTHVWQLAVRYYTPHLKGETPNVLVGAPTYVLSQDTFGTEWFAFNGPLDGSHDCLVYMETWLMSMYEQQA